MDKSFWAGFEKQAGKFDIVGGLRKGFGAAANWLGTKTAPVRQAIGKSSFGQGVSEMSRDVGKTQAGQWAKGQARQVGGMIRRNPGKSIAAAGAIGYGGAKLTGGQQNPSQQQSVNVYGQQRF